MDFIARKKGAFLDFKSKDNGDPTPSFDELARNPTSVKMAHKADPNKKLICITVKEARHLMAADVNPESSDPYAIVTLGKEKFETRVVTRNRFPMWEQRYLFPVDNLLSDAPLRIAIYDKDIMSKSDFLGEVVLELSIIQEMCRLNPFHTANGLWQNVRYKKETKGAICIGFQELDGEAAERVQRSLTDFTLENLIQRYEGRTLQVVLQCLSGFRSSGLLSTRYANSGNLYVRLRVNSTKLDCKAQVPLTIGYGPVMFSEEHKLTIPIRFGGFNPEWGRGVVVKSPFEKLDLKVYLVHKDMLGSTIIAKAQVPLWAVPEQGEQTASLRKSGSGLPHSEVVAGGVPATILETAPSDATSSISDGGEEGTPPEDIGVQFMRIMEPYLPSLADDLSLEFCCMLLPKDSPTATLLSPAISNVSNVPDTIADDENEEVDGAEPVPAPAPLEHSIVDCELPLGVGNLHNLLLSGYSEFLKGIHNTERLSNVEIGEYQSSPGVVQQRVVKYSKPLNIPMAPPQCEVTEEQKILVKEKGGFIADIIVRNNAPLAENFYVKLQFWGVMQGVGCCKFRVTMEVVFEKEPTKIRFLKGTIIRSAAEDSRRFCGALVTALRTYVANSAAQRPLAAGGAAEPAAAPGGVELLPAVGSLHAPPAPAAAGPAALGGVPPLAAVGLGLLSLLVLLVLILMGEVRSLKRHVAKLAAEGGRMCSA